MERGDRQRRSEGEGNGGTREGAEAPTPSR